MHPPPFNPSHTIAHWPHCHLDVRCPGCGKAVVVPLRMLRTEARAGVPLRQRDQIIRGWCCGRLVDRVDAGAEG